MIASKAFVIAALCVVATLGYTPFKPCGNGEPAPKALRVVGCKSDPCIFYRGTDVVAEWDFAVAADTDNLKPKVLATVLGITVNYPLPEQDACKSLTNGECPLDKGEEVTYGLKMPILSKYPKVSLALQFSLYDAKKNTHVCFKIKAKVADK